MYLFIESCNRESYEIIKHTHILLNDLIHFSELVHFKGESIQGLWFLGELTLYMELKSFLNTVEDTCTFFKPLKYSSMKARERYS